MTNKNPSEWRVSSNPSGGKTLYGVYRIRDVDAIEHSGNRETYGYYHSIDKAKRVAAQLNKGEKPND